LWIRVKSLRYDVSKELSVFVGQSSQTVAVMGRLEAFGLGHGVYNHSSDGNAVDTHSF
jgi:Na+-transporting NADH:ubiquinone oxidoreductase subunit D